MAYIKNTWTDQNVERPRTYDMQNNSDGSVTLIDSFGMVTDLGTPVNADNMNHIENGISNVGIWQYDSSVVYAKDDAVISVVDNKFVLYKSLKDQNLNNPLSDKTSWEEVNLGGGSGLELCDIGMALYVDETKGLRRYLNGQIVDRNTNTEAFFTRLQEITTLHPSLLCTEEEWQTEKTLSKFGQVGKFVFNYSGDEIISVRIPRVVNVQGLFDLQNLGLRVDESLPNVTGSIDGVFITSHVTSTQTGAFKKSVRTPATNRGVDGGSETRYGNVMFNASDSSSTYQDGASVQQEAIQYPYFIQIATGSETENNIVNDIELNNPYSLFDSKYSDHELNNLSWLKSEGQWNAKAVYTDAYDKLLKVYNGTETVEGLSVKLSTETYTDYDFVLNTANETFRLPLKTNLASGKAVVGNGMTIGVTNGTTNYGMTMGFGNSGDCVGISTKVYGKSVASGWSGGTLSTRQSIGLTTDPTKSGIELSDSDLYLYFYVGETVQNANLIDAGRIGEQLANKQDTLQYKMVDSYVNGTSGYNVWKTPLGYYCEQWGRFGSSDGADTTVTFLKTFKDTNYLPMVGQQYGNQGNSQFRTFNIYTIRTNSMIIHNTTNGWNTCIWQASGYLADGEY